MKFIKKYWLIILLIIITIIRFFMSYDLPTFYFKNLNYDDNLMIKISSSLLNHEYLGTYHNLTLTKGFMFPLFLAISNLINLNYATGLTIIYIFSCILFSISLKDLINKKFIILIYLVLLFNPISYSIELFQRLYRNSLSLSQTLLFFSFIIRIIKNDNLKKNIINYILLGLITGIMYLTREDNIWCMVILIFLFLYKFFKNRNIKSFILNLSPIIVLFLILNIVSFINYKYYGNYTYNELSNSSFKDCYIKIQEIKDTKKINRVSITRESLLNLASVSKKLDISIEEIEKLYENPLEEETEITNDHIIWYLRHLIYQNKRFKTAKEANIYFKELALEIDELFKNNKLEKEFSVKSTFINTPTKNDLKLIPNNLFKIIKYTSSYDNIRTISMNELKKMPNLTFDKENNTYYTYYRDYNNTENITKNNIKSFENIRIIYKYFTIIFSIISIILYLLNIKNIFKKNMFIITLIFISYLMIILGVTITHTTGFEAIRYYYLGNTYLLENIFIILILGVFYERIRINNFITMFKRRKNN